MESKKSDMMISHPVTDNYKIECNLRLGIFRFLNFFKFYVACLQERTFKLRCHSKQKGHLTYLAAQNILLQLQVPFALKSYVRHQRPKCG